MPRRAGDADLPVESGLVNAEQARIANILARAVAKYIRDDQAADYPLPDPVSVVIRSHRVAKFVRKPYTTKDGSLSVTSLGENRVELRANRFPRSGLWNGPDAIPNDTLRGMLSSLFHDLIWGHAKEFAEAWGTTDLEVLRWGGDVLYLVWVWASKDSWLGRREAWLAFQTTQFAAPWYHNVKKILSKSATMIAVLLGLCSVSGCYSLPDGEVESVDGVEVVGQVMSDYGDGLGPGPKSEKEAR